ncbi:Protein RecA [Myxococcaceae bacterium]|nr:Protein RecA [Myxococcaceae bacterium]
MPSLRPAAIDALLEQLGPRLRRGGLAAERPARCATGHAALDALLCGGLPRGRISELAGSPSSGRTSLLLSLLAGHLRGGEIAAWVDASDAFDPTSAEAAGVALSRLLWVRAPDVPSALRCAERLLETQGLPLVILDLDRITVLPRVPPHAWPRLARAATASSAALVVLAAERLAGTAAECAIRLEPAPPRFTGRPALFEGLEARAVLLRSREAPEGRAVPLRLFRRRPAQ